MKARGEGKKGTEEGEKEREKNSERLCGWGEKRRDAVGGER